MLEPDCESKKLSAIHQLTYLIEEKNIEGILDVVPAYESIAIIFDEAIKNHLDLINVLNELPHLKSNNTESKLHRIPVCYELGIDWEEVMTHTGKSKELIIETHSAKVYKVAMMGFLPGFVFLEGLEPSISCPRKSTPRTSIPAGSIGIGGDQTGIYSLESPGGWNIIGRTPTSFFEVGEKPPTKLRAGDQIIFTAISKSQFEEV
ncbi:MAG: 5-oxoprolinase subunit PxpB [Balneolaceae bacterium]